MKLKNTTWSLNECNPLMLSAGAVAARAEAATCWKSKASGEQASVGFCSCYFWWEKETGICISIVDTSIARKSDTACSWDICKWCERCMSIWSQVFDSHDFQCLRHVISLCESDEEFLSLIHMGLRYAGFDHSGGGFPLKAKKTTLLMWRWPSTLPQGTFARCIRLDRSQESSAWRGREKWHKIATQKWPFGKLLFAPFCTLKAIFRWFFFFREGNVRCKILDG